MKIRYIGENDYMARIKSGDVFDVISFTNNELGKTIRYEINNVTGESVYLDSSECILLTEGEK